MNIVMLDSARLTGEVDFPEVDLDKFSWEQFVSLDETEAVERCWRADVIISADTPVTQQVIDNAFKLKLIVAAGDNTKHIDHAAAEARGIQIMNVPGVMGDNPEHTETICNSVVEQINHWLKSLRN